MGSASPRLLITDFLSLCHSLSHCSLCDIFSRLPSSMPGAEGEIKRHPAPIRWHVLGPVCWVMISLPCDLLLMQMLCCKSRQQKQTHKSGKGLSTPALPAFTRVDMMGNSFLRHKRKLLSYEQLQLRKEIGVKSANLPVGIFSSQMASKETWQAGF